jgi:zinc protease
VLGNEDPSQDDARLLAVTPADVADAAQRYVEVPAAIGELIPERGRSSDAPPPPSSGVTDDFTHRVATGPIVQPPWLVDALAKPLSISSKILPTYFSLSNGLRVYVQEVHQNPTVFISGAIDTSPRSDPPGKEGLGAMVSSLMNYGSGANDFEAQRKLLGDLDATLDLGFAFDAHGLADDLPAIAKLLASGLAAPRFDPTYVDLVRKQTLAAVEKRDHDSAYLSTRAFEELMLAPDDPTLREPTKESISSITTDDLRAYAQRCLRPDLTSISVVGDVDPIAVRRVFKEAFGDWKPNGAPPDVTAPAIPARSATARRTLTAERIDVDVHLGQPAPLRGGIDGYALTLMNEILGADGAFDSRLVRDLRFRENLVYAISSTYDSDRYRGTFNVRFRAGLPSAQRAIGAVESELTRLQNEPVSDGELARAKTKIVASALVAEEATDVIAARVQNIAANDLRADYYTLLAGKYASVSPADILRVARGYLRPGALVEVLEGPHQ